MKMPIPLNGNYLTVEEAAIRLDVSPGRVRQFIVKGRLASIQIKARVHLIDERAITPLRREIIAARERQGFKKNS